MIKKIRVAVVMSMMSLMVLAGSAFAEGVADTSVVTSMTSLKDDLVATLQSVAPLAIGIMAIFLAWRYGKRLFKTVAK